MTGKEFLEQLEKLLKDLPEHDREDALAYYKDYLEEYKSNRLLLGIPPFLRLKLPDKIFHSNQKHLLQHVYKRHLLF